MALVEKIGGVSVVHPKQRSTSIICRQQKATGESLVTSYNSDWHTGMPFWIDTDSYSQVDRDMFVCGVEFQMVYQTILEKRDWDQCIHAENESRVRMMRGKLGVPVQMKRHDDTWTHCYIPASTTI